MKRMILLMNLVVFLTVFTFPAFAAKQPPGFTDVGENQWYAEAVEYVQSRGLMNGTTPTTFSPNAGTSRAMLVTVLYRSAGSPEVSGESTFSDVKNGYYTDAVIWAAQNGVVNGYPNGTFGVNSPITRQEAATILWRYEGEPKAEAGTDFADEAQISNYAAKAVDWARAEGIINGRPGNRFDPRGQATRAEIAEILKNYLSKKEGGEPAPGPNPSPDPDPNPGPSPAPGGKTLVVYFSATGSTKRVGGYIADALGADTFEIIPENPYTSADLNWTDQNSRVVYEHDNPDARIVELVSDTVDNWAEYDRVYIGYPIWWGIAAWPVDAFIKANDFTGKIVIPFCTSSSSGLGESGSLLAEMAGTGDWQEGMRFPSSASEETVAEWVQGLV